MEEYDDKETARAIARGLQIEKDIEAGKQVSLMDQVIAMYARSWVDSMNHSPLLRNMAWKDGDPHEDACD